MFMACPLSAVPDWDSASISAGYLAKSVPAAALGAPHRLFGKRGSSAANAVLVTAPSPLAG